MPAIAPVADLLDTLIPDPVARDAARIELLKLGNSPELARLSAIIADAGGSDPWTRRARPTFLYVAYALLLWSIPMGVLAAFDPALAHNMAAGMTGYLRSLPEPLYALFGTGYLGYTAARQWGKIKGTDR
ncbi:MAG: 3TM-type holin [Sphingomonadales bacterium]|jgi:hypothetical protein